MRCAVAIAGLALVGLVGCETYEFPPRLIGVGTDDCPECEELVLSETRLPAGAGAVDIDAQFAFKDDRGAISKLQAFVTTPSGVVLEEFYFVEVTRWEEVEVPPDTDGETESTTERVEITTLEKRFRPGFTCTYASATAEDVGSNTCEVSSTRANAGSSIEVGPRLAGYESGGLSVTFGLEVTELGRYTVEFVATRSDGTQSNRLSNTFDVVEDVGPDTDGDRVDPGTTGSGTESG